MASNTLTGIVGTVTFGLGLALGSIGNVDVPATPGDVEFPMASTAAWLSTGEKVYAVPVVHPDGGREVTYRSAVNPPCRRRKAGAAGLACMRLVKTPDGGVTIEVQPEVLWKYPAAEMVGLGCEGVACSSLEGTDPFAPEVAP